VGERKFLFSTSVQTTPADHRAVKRAGRCLDRPPTSSAEVKERIELYLFYTTVPSQAEQIAILMSLEQLPSVADQTNRIVAIYTDSNVTLASLKNNNIHSFLIEEIRNKVRNLTKQNWSVHFGW
jgi:chromosome segregation and condensation protein ScpB